MTRARWAQLIRERNRLISYKGGLTQWEMGRLADLNKALEGWDFEKYQHYGEVFPLYDNV